MQEVVDAVRDTVVGHEERLDGGEDEHRAVSSSSAKQKSLATALRGHVGRAYAVGPIFWEMAMASWKIKRMDSCASSPQSPRNKLSWRSCASCKEIQSQHRVQSNIRMHLQG